MGSTSISIPALLKGTTHDGLVSISIAPQFFPNISPDEPPTASQDPAKQRTDMGRTQNLESEDSFVFVFLA
jgi:hypothetical protein